MPQSSLTDRQPDHRMVEISSPDFATRRVFTWHGMTVETVQIASQTRTSFLFRSGVDLLIAYEGGERCEGDTYVEGAPRSSLRQFSRKFTVVPAGCEFLELQAARTSTQLVFVYFDFTTLGFDHAQSPSVTALAPRVFFDDPALWSTLLKLKHSLDRQSDTDRLYSSALGVVLVHELLRFNRGLSPIESPVRGGLAPWQQRLVTSHIDANLGELVTLATLAKLARLSPHHFCRAFKRSFGVPPHRFHINRRIEHAKSLLLSPGSSVTDTGLTLGFSETSSFSAAFRKETGFSPTDYRRTHA